MNSYGFKKGQKVIQVINIVGSKSATLQIIDRVKDRVVFIEGSSNEYDDFGRQIDACIPGCTSELIPLDGGEEERMQHMLTPPKSKTKKSTRKK